MFSFEFVFRRRSIGLIHTTKQTVLDCSVFFALGKYRSAIIEAGRMKLHCRLRFSCVTIKTYVSLALISVDVLLEFHVYGFKLIDQPEDDPEANNRSLR